MRGLGGKIPQGNILLLNQMKGGTKWSSSDLNNRISINGGDPGLIK